MADIFDLVEKGDLERVKSLIASQPDLLNAQTVHRGRTPLHVAILWDHVDIIDFLLEKKVNVNLLDRKGRNALIYLAKRDPIYAGSEYEIGTKLINAGVNLNQKCNVNFKFAPLHYAITRNKSLLVELLIKRSADWNIRTKTLRTPLHLAASNKDRFLILKKLVDAYPQNINDADMNGSTALHSASNHECLESVKYLVSKGADISLKDNSGRTPVANTIHPEVVDYLLSIGADVNTVDVSGCTLLHLAIDFYDRSDVVEVILKYGPDTSIRAKYYGNQMLTAKDCAMKRLYTKSYRLINDYDSIPDMKEPEC